SGLETLLIENSVVIRVRPPSEGGNPLLSFLILFGPALLIIGFYEWMYRRAKQGGGIGGMGNFMGIDRSKAKRFDKATDKKVTFDDLAIIEINKQELVQEYECLHNQ